MLKKKIPIPRNGTYYFSTDVVQTLFFVGDTKLGGNKLTKFIVSYGFIHTSTLLATSHMCVCVYIYIYMSSELLKKCGFWYSNHRIISSDNIDFYIINSKKFNNNNNNNNNNQSINQSFNFFFIYILKKYNSLQF